MRNEYKIFLSRWRKNFIFTESFMLARDKSDAAALSASQSNLLSLNGN